VVRPKDGTVVSARKLRGGSPPIDAYTAAVTKLTWAAPERNKEPVLTVLQRVLPATGTLLELASGTGQHAVHFARNLPSWTIQPSDIDAENLASIQAWASEASLPNLRFPIELDVCDIDWNVAALGAIFNANMIHIAPWHVTLGLIRGAARHLLPGGLLVMYGPFRVGGQHTALSNETFDDTLRQRDVRFGVRDLEAVVSVAQQHGLTLQERIEMPANNQVLVFALTGK
jgi:SAM-dependent methyltransferase